jgi:hypothetical protein
MHVDLSDADVELLTEILTGVISDLSPEIADTDNPRYRQQLRERRARIVGLLKLLGQPANGAGDGTSGTTSAGGLGKKDR